MKEEMLTHNSVKIDFIKCVWRGGMTKRLDAELGRMSKRIIDYCRSKFIEQEINSILKEKGREERFHSELVSYCEEKESVENCIILGWLNCGVCSILFSMQLKSNLWSCEIQKSEIPKECLEEEVILGIDEAGRGPVMGNMLF